MKAPTLTELDDDQKLVLRQIVERGIIRGSELLRSTSMDPTALGNTVRELNSMDLIKYSGNVTDPNEIPYVVFSVRPSDRKFLKYATS